MGSSNTNQKLIFPYKIVSQNKIRVNIDLYPNKEIKSSLKNPNQIIVVKKSDKKFLSLGINIGSYKTVYSLFENDYNKPVSNVLLMNESSSRIIPSIICYTKDHRLFGDNSISSLRQNIETSYKNLSRLIGFENNILFKDELKYGFGINEEFNKYKFKSKGINGIKEIESENIISDYLSLINDYYFEKNKINYDYSSISLPDFFTPKQKQILKLICDSLEMKNVQIYNESSAITMYYGYNKYKDLFSFQNKNIEKNVLFIDSGHSKTNFILSKFAYNKFSVEYVDCIIDFGGRNFDNLLGEYCLNEFKKENNLNDYKLDAKSKYKLLDAIQKSRVKLTVNDETNITIYVFYDDIDLEINLTREKFEEIIREELKKFENKLKEIINIANEKNIKIDYVEIAGELMRTPCLQNIIIDNNLQISKTILIDECASVGAAILRDYEVEKEKFPIFLESFTHFNSYYDITFQLYDKNNVGLIGNIIPDKDNEKKIIELDIDIEKNNENIFLDIFLENKKLNINDLLLQYKIALSNILNSFTEDTQKDLKYFLIKIKRFNKIINAEISLGDKYNLKILKEPKNANGNLRMYKIKEEEEDFIEELKKYIKNKKDEDFKYHYFLTNKLVVSKEIFSLKYLSKYNDLLKNEEEKLTNLDRELRNLEDIKLLEDIDKKVNEIFNKYEKNLIENINSIVLENKEKENEEWVEEVKSISSNLKNIEKNNEKVEEIRSIYEIDEVKDYINNLKEEKKEDNK